MTPFEPSPLTIRPRDRADRFPTAAALVLTVAALVLLVVPLARLVIPALDEVLAPPDPVEETTP